VASYGSAVFDACTDARRRLEGLGANESVGDYLTRQPLRAEVVGEANSKPGDERRQYSMHAFGAHFAEVRVNPDTGEVRVARFLGAFACGRIVNAKTATSQFKGGIVMGIGMALTEESVIDSRHGQFVNADLAEYHVPTNRDIPQIEILLVDEDDPHVNPLGTKGIGEIGIVGAAAAVANAMFNATGRRIRDLPITPDKVLA
jgi:xanthine dehydrogenase YagR molybdenum-binding subunit